MRELRLHIDEAEGRADVIPFPGREAGRLTRRSPIDSIRMAERALERVERSMDELHDLIEPIRIDPDLFRWEGNDGPSAA